MCIWKYTFLECKRDKEAIYHIGILPKNSIFKIMEIQCTTPYLAWTHLKSKLANIGEYYAKTRS